jgi:CubicO group peptidase (beta-lactamase class C family)
MLLEEDDRLRRRRYGPLENGRSGRKRTGRRVGEQGVSAGRQPQGSVGLDVVNDLTERAMRSGQRVGLVIGCLAGNEQRVAGYGRLRTDAQDTPDGGTIFEIGSVTKVFTGLLLADLAEGGLIGLDDPLASYLPAWVRVPTFGGHQLTLADLASHAGGLRRDPKGTLRRWLGNRHNPNAGLSVESLYAGLARTKLRRRPGERVKYSNLGAGLLGDALARAAGQPYEELVRERICRPLGMRDTVVTLTSEQTARLAAGHTRRGRPAPPLEIPALVGAGALRSTATDLLRFLRANLKPADTPLTAQIERTQLPQLRVAKRTEIGLGWMIARLPGLAGPMLWHNGGTPGFRSFVGVGRETGTAVVVLSNTARSVDRLGLRLLNVLSTHAS